MDMPVEKRIILDLEDAMDMVNVDNTKKFRKDRKMATKLNKEAYKNLINNEDIKWLTKETEDCPEQNHIISVLKDSIRYYYECEPHIDELLKITKLVYRKHHLGDDTIGWDELATMLCDTLCNVMGDGGFQEWLEANR